jgi:hypothetical protein
MKTLLLLLITLFSISSYSQVDRRVGQGQYKRQHKQKSIADVNEETLSKLNKELNLDGFQEAVAKNLIADFNKSAKEVKEAESLKNEEKSELLIGLAEKFKFKLFEILNEEQKNKYNAMLSGENKKKKK